MNINKNVIKVIIVFLSFCQGLQFSITPVLFKMQTAYPTISINLIQMLVTAPMLMAAFVAVLSGWLVTKISKKTLLLVGCFICFISGVLPLISDSFQLLFYCRLILGVGLGLITVLNTAVIAEFFDGDEHISVMGLQGASVGVGMVFITTLSGYLGRYNFKFAYVIHILALIALIIVFRYLPKSKTVVLHKREKIKVDKVVYGLAILTFLEFIFIISFSTNIAMHMSSYQLSNSVIVGIILGIFSGVQIIAGLTLRYISSFTKENTLLLAMGGFSIGAFLIMISSGNIGLIIIGTIFIGLSQGVFTPRVLFEATYVSEKQAQAMSVAVITFAICLGQLLSPILLNSLTEVIWGTVVTSSVFLLGAIIMFVIPLSVFFVKVNTKFLKGKI